MLCLFFIWLTALVVMWLYAAEGIRHAANRNDAATRLATFHVILFAALPPTLILILLAGSESGLRFWSIWQEQDALFRAVTFLDVCYLLWAMLSMLTNHRPWMRVVIFVAFACCLSVWPLLALPRD
ncbi:MAG: hypothetical protein FJ271_29955 [Planctomycetes bacterium]|nr:hypothetical protein [Planctomycetota bacterium]